MTETRGGLLNIQMEAENRSISQFHCYPYCMGILTCSVMPFATSLCVAGDEIWSKTPPTLCRDICDKRKSEPFSVLQHIGIAVSFSAGAVVLLLFFLLLSMLQYHLAISEKTCLSWCCAQVVHTVRNRPAI